jgi:hypothetical protein
MPFDVHSDRSTDFDRFSYRHFDEQPLTLEEAVKKSQEQKKADPLAAYRVVPTDDQMTGFRIERVSREKLYADFLKRFNGHLIRFYNTFRRS